MFEELKKILDEMDKTVDKEAVINDIVPAEVILKVDENGNATIKVDGRNKEICCLVGDLIASCAEYDKNNAKKLLDAIKLACNLRIRMSKNKS